MNFATFIIAAVIVEGIVEYAASKWVTGDMLRYIALGIGVVFCIGYQLDLLAAFGLTAINPYISYVVTGILIGRGSNYLNDLLSTLTGKLSTGAGDK